MTTTAGTTTTNRQSIADVFASFYEELYELRPPSADVADTSDHSETNGNDEITPFSAEELDKALSQLRSGRCRDTNGVLAEMLKEGGGNLRSHLLQLYNDVTSQHSTPPQQWKQTTISVLYKSGDPLLASNYRPIAIIPVLYKLFARLLYNRLEPLLDRYQTPDQAGFRHDYSTEDHLFTTTILHERSQEWQLPLWVAAIDFKKAFDTIDHNRLWQALHHQHVPPQYIRLLKSLYANQTATVKTDKMSRQFHIQRGVKQGDPLSALLFNALLEDIFTTLKQRWSTRNYGIRLGHTNITSLTNLRFADDVLLFATTLPQLTTMLNDLHQVAGKCGLELHPDKTVILSNLSQRRGRQAGSSADVGGRRVKVLNYSDSTKYLGRKLTFDDHHAAEIDNRIATAWRKFNALRSELTNKRYRLHSRIHLFDATITPTILYGCVSWTTTMSLNTKLQRTQRRMLRLIIGTARRQHTSPTQMTTEATLEAWPDYIKRATTLADAQLRKLHIESWPNTYLKRKWRWASRIAKQPTTRWTRLAANWKPQLDHKRSTTRRQARPYKRWSDDFDAFLQAVHDDNSSQANPTQWLDVATNDATWSQLEHKFITYMNTAQQQRSSSTG